MPMQMPALPAAAQMILSLGLLLLLALPLQLRAQPVTPDVLAQRIDAVIQRSSLESATIGILVRDLATGQTLYGRNAEKSFVPASNVKLYTTAAALDQLGPDYRYETRLYLRGDLQNRLLDGDLIIRGSGDPTFSPQFHDEQAGRVLEQWADALEARNITNISGDLIGDDDIFSDIPYGRGWSWGDFPYYYSAEIGGLNYHDNSFELTVATGAPGTQPELELEPSLPGYVQFLSAVDTRARGTAHDLDVARRFGSNIFELSGHLPAYTTVTTTLAVHNPTRYFLSAFQRHLQGSDISLRGDLVDVDLLAERPDYEAPALQQIATYVSPPLRDIVAATNKPSNNLYAELLLRTLGVERPVPPTRLADDDVAPGSAAMGLAAAMRTYARAEIDTSRLFLVDGSGLSRMNLVTPTMTANLLSYMWQHPDESVREAYYRSLAVAGEEEGTLERRLEDPVTAGNVHAKTGTLTHVSALSGYVRSAGGAPLVFSIMSNNHITDSDVAERLQDAIVTLLSRYEH